MNGILNVAIGLAMTFGTVSLVTSAIAEAFASLLNLRSKTLLAGIKQLLNDPKANGLALAIYQHAAVNPLGSGAVPADSKAWQATEGTYKEVSALVGKMPSYVDSKGFASALIDAIQNRQQPSGFIPDVTQAIGEIKSPQLKAIIGGLNERAGQNIDQLHDKIANWFDASMDRLSGDYKRKSQWMSLLIAAFLVVFLDVDALSIARHVYVDPALVQHVATKTGESPDMVFSEWSTTFPFGWDGFLKAWSGNGLPLTVLTTLPGWILTIAATLFGAPFWFDTLQRFVQIRGTGPETNVDPTKPTQA